MREYAVRRNWEIAAEIEEVGFGVVQRRKREELLAAVRHRELDAILVWRPTLKAALCPISSLR